MSAMRLDEGLKSDISTNIDVISANIDLFRYDHIIALDIKSMARPKILALTFRVQVRLTITS
jgi:hypothetical protein